MNRSFSLLAAASGFACLGLLAGCGGDNAFSGDDSPLPDQDIWAVTATGALVWLDNDGLEVLSNQALTGMAVAETVLGADFRPATGQLYILGSTGQLYTVDTTTAVTTPIGAPITVAGTNVGFDFNPSVDRIRIITSTGENLRVHPDTGALVAADTTISPAGNYVGAAYTPAGAGEPTTLYAVEVNGSSLGTIGGIGGTPSPNGGQFSMIDTLGITINAETHFDIDSRGNGYLTSFDGTATRLYHVKLDNGDLEELGNTTLRLAGMGIIP